MWRRQHKFTWIAVTNFFSFSLPSQPFLGCHFGFHIFFPQQYSWGRTLFFTAGLFWIRYTYATPNKFSISDPPPHLFAVSSQVPLLHILPLFFSFSCILYGLTCSIKVVSSRVSVLSIWQKLMFLSLLSCKRWSYKLLGCLLHVIR